MQCINVFWIWFVFCAMFAVSPHRNTTMKCNVLMYSEMQHSAPLICSGSDSLECSAICSPRALPCAAQCTVQFSSRLHIIFCTAFEMCSPPHLRLSCVFAWTALVLQCCIGFGLDKAMTAKSLVCQFNMHAYAAHLRLFLNISVFWWIFFCCGYLKKYPTHKMKAVWIILCLLYSFPQFFQFFWIFQFDVRAFGNFPFMLSFVGLKALRQPKP